MNKSARAVANVHRLILLVDLAFLITTAHADPPKWAWTRGEKVRSLRFEVSCQAQQFGEVSEPQAIALPIT